MKVRQVFSVFAIVVAVPCIATAQPPGGGRGPGGPGGRGPGGHGPGGSPLEMISQMFDQIDANQDGSITKAELTAQMNNEQRGLNRGQRELSVNGRRGGDRAQGVQSVVPAVGWPRPGRTAGRTCRTWRPRRAWRPTSATWPGAARIRCRDFEYDVKTTTEASRVAGRC